MFNGEKELFSKAHWRGFAFTEGVVQVIQLAILFLVTDFFLSPMVAFVFVGLVAVFRILLSFVLIRRAQFALYPNSKAVFGSMLSGLVYAFSIFVPLYAFFIEDVSLTFFAIIFTAGFLPTAYLSSLIQSKKLPLRSWASLFLAILAFVFIGGLTLFVENITTPLWFSISVLLALVPLADDMIVRSNGTAAVISPWVHAFWTSLGAIIVSFVALVTFNLPILTEGMFLGNLGAYWVYIFAFALFSIVAIFARQKTFRQMGGRFAKKRLVMISVVLLGSFLIDLFVTSQVTFGEMIALILVLFAYALADNAFRK